MNENVSAMLSMGRSLSGSYPYAYRVGAYLRRTHPHLYQRFSEEAPLHSEKPLPQAQNFAFVSYLEATLPEAQQLNLFEEFFSQASDSERLELENTVSWYQRSP